MQTHDFIDSLHEEDRPVFELFRQAILAADTSVVEKPGAVMGHGNALVYSQDSVSKYAIARTKNYYSFHSMVLYACPELMDELRSKIKNVRFNKGCVNFKSVREFPPEVLSDLMEKSAGFDFTPVIEHYINKKK